MKKLAAFVYFVAVFCLAAIAQTPSAGASPEATTQDISGMYSFVREGEFVQINVEDGKVSGLVSRFEGDNPDSSRFVDQFFDKASFDGKQLTFKTKEAKGQWYEFSGTVSRGPGKTTDDEQYWVIKGKVTEHTPSGSVKEHDLEMRSFPRE